MGYPWQKFHLAAEMLRKTDDVRKVLPEAFAQEISHINDVDMPAPFRERILAAFDRLSISDNVETITRMGHPHQAIKNMSDDEIKDFVQEIYELEKELHGVSV